MSDRKMKKVEMVDGPPQHLYIFEGREPVRGRVRVTLPPGKKLEHLGVKVELKGTIGRSCASVCCIAGHNSLGLPVLVPCMLALTMSGFFRTSRLCTAELYYDRGNVHEFLNVPLQLATPGELTGAQVRRCEVWQ